MENECNNGADRASISQALLAEVWSIHPFRMEVISLPSHEPICALENSDETRTFQRGLLVAQSPELYRALKAIMDHFGPGTMPEDLFERGNLALAAAEGRNLRSSNAPEHTPDEL